MSAETLAMQLGRIEGAKDTLQDKVLAMGLKYYDPEEGTATKRPVVEEDKIDVLATAVYQIPYYPHGDVIESGSDGNEIHQPNTGDTGGILIYGKYVRIKEGYYSGYQQAEVKSGSVETPTVSINPDTGAITVTKTHTEGYISGGSQDYDAGTVQHTNLKAENIKDGTTIFGIEGTFTEDANALANKIVEGFSAYVKGAKVEGAIPDNGDMGLRTFNPLVDDEWSIDVPVDTGAVVKGLQVSLSDELINRLSAI